MTIDRMRQTVRGAVDDVTTEQADRRNHHPQSRHRRFADRSNALCSRHNAMSRKHDSHALCSGDTADPQAALQRRGRKQHSNAATVSSSGRKQHSNAAAPSRPFKKWC